MSDSLIPVKCPRCGHEWHVDVEELKKQQQGLIYKMYRGKSPTTDYRVTCPNDGTIVVVTVREEASDG